MVCIRAALWTTSELRKWNSGLTYKLYIAIAMGISAKNLIDLVIIFDSSEMHRRKCTGIVLSAMQENCLQGFF